MNNRFENLMKSIDQKRKLILKEHPELYKSLSAIPNVNKDGKGRAVLKSYLSTLGRLLHSHPRKRYLRFG
ncbi:hypothetical protein [Chondrinema litorale]|uniref:hypothetical protein n=1 Tax=Chondrinema litorale TaxID=2994555 RepID=UPI002542E261|nr:hypothetical protein [Chondrinema litorale]UZR98191.1 hypothetical protein OQ292_29780 [Chondrinema litorale]